MGVAVTDVDAHGAGVVAPTSGGERAGFGIPAGGGQPGRGGAVLQGAPVSGSGAERARVLQRVRRALVRGGLPAAVRPAGELRAAPVRPAGAFGAGAAAAGAAEHLPAAAARTRPRCRRTTRSRPLPGRCGAGGSGCARGTAGCRRRRATGARSGTCCSMWRCSARSRTRWRCSHSPAISPTAAGSRAGPEPRRGPGHWCRLPRAPGIRPEVLEAARPRGRASWLGQGRGCGCGWPWRSASRARPRR